MKSYFIRVVSFFNSWLLKAKGARLKGLFYFVKITKNSNNRIDLINVDVRKTLITINGEKNEFICNDAQIENSSISIFGSDNKILVKSGVKLRNAKIIVRGHGCSLEIGANTSFGGVRIVNVGTKNSISIGEDCLFSDHIEIWASDTHPIFNEQDEWINREKPISVGNRVWVGSRVIILKGVTIGDGSIIGMGSLITRDVSPYTISAGFPNKEMQTGVKWKLDYPFE